MSATNKTPNLDLPQWVRDDEIEREDFNEAFLTLDGAIERGGDDASWWIRYPDGTQICGIKITASVTMHNQYGGTATWFYHSGGVDFGNWAKPFVVQPHAVFDVSSGSNVTQLVRSSGTPLSNTAAGTVYCCSAIYVSTARNVTLTTIGFGRWK